MSFVDGCIRGTGVLVLSWVLALVSLTMGCQGPRALTQPAQPVALAKSPETETAGCRSDEDCKAARACRDGRCVARVARVDRRSLARLEAGEIGLGALREAKDARWCQIANAIGRDCSMDSECPGNALCFRKHCRVPESMPKSERPEGYRPSCVSDAECDPGLACTNGACSPGPIAERLRLKLESLSDVRALSAFAAELAANSSSQEPSQVLAEWLLLALDVGKSCGAPLEATVMRAVARRGQAFVSEGRVDKALSDKDCELLGAIHGLDLWPYQYRFIKEIDSRQFSDAEVTRRTWLKAVQTMKNTCGKRMGSRARVAVDVTMERLESIVGLNDPLLIRLRTALLEALERDDANAVAKYSQAVAEREKAIDARHAAAYEARVAELQRRLAEEQAKPKQPPVASAAAKPKNDGTSAAQDIDTAIETTDKALETTNRAIDTANKIGSLFGW